MKEQLKFTSTNPVHKKFAAELRKEVNAYFKEKGISIKGNFKMWLKAITMLTLYLAPLIVILTVSMNAWLALILVVIMGIGEAGIGMSVMHDAAHGAFSKKQWVNDLLAGTMFLLGSNVFNWQIQHNYLHHTFTNIYGHDPDIDTKAVIRLSDRAPLKRFHRFQYIYAYPFYGLMTLSKLVSDIGQLVTYHKQGHLKQRKISFAKEMIKLIVIKVIYLSIIIGFPFLFTDYSWWQILLGFAVMHVVAGAIMGTVFQMAHVVENVKQPVPDENGVIDKEWMVHELTSASDFARNSRLLSWYVGGLNFQIEHHLFPHICHVHYPAIARIVEKTAKNHNLSYDLKPTFFHSFISHVRKLKELGWNRETIISGSNLETNSI